MLSSSTKAKLRGSVDCHQQVELSLLSPRLCDNTASDVWADTAYRSRDNEAWLKRMGRVSRIHRKKPQGKPMPARTASANAARSTIRARVEHVFARQKDHMGMFVRTIGIARAEAKITLANLSYNIDRLIFHERRAAAA